MRCAICGYIVGVRGCPCGSTSHGREEAIPIGTKVLARPGRGPSTLRWSRGEVQAHLGSIHRVDTEGGIYWCESDDILPDSPRRNEGLRKGVRVWGRWLDGCWYPGTVQNQQGPLRQVVFDDSDVLWTEAWNLVPIAVPASEPGAGATVLAERWDGRYEPGTVEQKEAGKFLIAFQDGDEAWISREGVRTDPPNPFLDPEIESP